jgi:hypothetical protein
MERETKTITTPGGRTVVLRSYLTGREENELKGILYADLKMNADDLQSGKMSITDIPASFVVKQEEKAIELLVVSVDGKSENAAQAVLDLPSSDYASIVDEINKLRNPTTPKN